MIVLKEAGFSYLTFLYRSLVVIFLSLVQYFNVYNYLFILYNKGAVKYFLESWCLNLSKVKKTNVMRLLEQNDIDYTEHHYLKDDTKNGVEVAQKMGNDPDQQFKTLMTEG